MSARGNVLRGLISCAQCSSLGAVYTYSHVSLPPTSGCSCLCAVVVVGKCTSAGVWAYLPVSGEVRCMWMN